MRRAAVLGCILCLFALPASAQTAPFTRQIEQPVAVATDSQTEPAIVDLDTVVVSGKQPGPGLWKVSRDGHTLYILGTLSPLPRRMEWISDEVESVIARAGIVIDEPSVSVDAGVGMFRGLLLLPSLLKARRNADGLSLQQVVPPELYTRWLPLKARYLGRSRKVEQWRPIFAAQELYEAAMKRSGLTQDSKVSSLVSRTAKRHRVPIEVVNVELEIKDPKSVIREFNAGTLADVECFSRTLSRIETDLAAMRARANAWAVGDIEALRALPYDDQYSACIRAVTETGLARRLGMSDLRQRVRAKWLAAADSAIAGHVVGFASLPISELLKPDGYLVQLQAKGYEVESPQPWTR